MPYRYLEDVAIADAAFEAWGSTVEEMILSACDAAINVMADALDSIRPVVRKTFRFEDPQLDMLLFQILQELIFFKDAERLLLRARSIQLRKCATGWSASVESSGEEIDPQRHALIVDVKAVTFHRLKVEQTGSDWRATVVLDV